jgi:hypothetical protein
MRAAYIEPRKIVWARAEVSWQDAAGALLSAPATLEDTSLSGACIRSTAPIEVGANLTVTWHCEKFCGVARNKRREGLDFLIGIERAKTALPPVATPILPTSPTSPASNPPALVSGKSPSAGAAAPAREVQSADSKPIPDQEPLVQALEFPVVDPPQESKIAAAAEPVPAAPEPPAPLASEPPEVMPAPRALPTSAGKAASPAPSASTLSPPVRQSDSRTLGASRRQERTVMESTPLFRKLWHRQQERTGGPVHDQPTEVPVAKPETPPAECPSDPPHALLSCEDIYRGSGILGGNAKYDIGKIVEMINSKHIRELPKEVRRASILMALDAAGTPIEEVLNDATRRLHALNLYETAQQTQFDQFEAAKLRENGQIKVELERVTSRYEERMQRNLDQVAREREAFSNWQAAKQQECDRIGEAVQLCGKLPILESALEAAPALAKAAAAATASTMPAPAPPAPASSSQAATKETPSGAAH